MSLPVYARLRLRKRFAMPFALLHRFSAANPSFRQGTVANRIQTALKHVIHNRLTLLQGSYCTANKVRLPAVFVMVSSAFETLFLARSSSTADIVPLGESHPQSLSLLYLMDLKQSSLEIEDEIKSSIIRVRGVAL